MFAALQQQSGGVNVLHHHREPASLDEQPVIRQNRDTLYSSAIVDISGGATLTLPDSGGRYLSVMVVNEDHYINRILHEPGTHELTVDEFDTDYVLVAARTLVDPNDPADVAEVNGLQDQMRLEAASAQAFVSPTTTRPRSTPPARRCSRSRAACRATTGLSAGRRTSIRSVT